MVDTVKIRIGHLGSWGALGLCFVTVVCARMVLAQDVPRNFRVGPIYDTGFPKLQVVVEFRNGKQGDLDDLKNDLQLIEDGALSNKPESIIPFQTAPFGMALVIAVDTSGSMYARPLESVKDGLRTYVDEIRPNDRVALITFDNTVNVRADFNSTKEQVRDAIENIHGVQKGITQLYKAIYKG